MQTLVVLPTSRAIRQKQLLSQNDILLPEFITMADFIQKLCLADGYKAIDEDTKILLLHQASNFKNFSSLKINRNFFTFLKNSSYIFSFFKELSGELCSIEALENADVYAEFEEHIQILKQLYDNYKKICLEKKFLDDIFLPELYKLNKDYIKRYNKIVLHVDGYLTNFEFKLLLECCEMCQVELEFSTTKFNKKMQNRFVELGLELKNGYTYLISLNNKKILKSAKIVQNTKIICEGFSESLLQVAFIKQKVYESIKDGYDPKNIVVILPDENMAKKIRDFDTNINFNFAMGWPFSKSEIYKLLKTNIDALQRPTQENLARLARIGEIDMLKTHYYDTINDSVVLFLEDLLKYIDDKIQKKIFQEELYKFKKILPYMKNVNFKTTLEFFMQRLAKRSIDDVLGGEITVMGVLESRSVDFDVAIIADFNETKVPKRSNKDMFLNTKVRKLANLPTTKDRQDLQKHYYKLLISKTKRLYISFVDSQTQMPSRFLKQLNIPTTNSNTKQYAKVLFDTYLQTKTKKSDIALEYHFKNTNISPSMLKTYLTCKRKYYFKYIQKIKEHNIPQDAPDEYEIGNIVHEVLKNIYSKKNSYHSVDELQKAINTQLDSFKNGNEFTSYLIDTQKKLLEPFCEMEVKRFDDGWSVFGCEIELQKDFFGAKLHGKIDRIDKKDENICVLDYKTGSYTLYNKNNYINATDFQLEIYYLLSSKIANVQMCGFYDLKKTQIVQEKFLDEKISLLQKHLKDMLEVKTINFEKCTNVSNCRFCPYKLICNR